MTRVRDLEPCPSTGRNLVAVIGIDRYRNWRKLSNAVTDARVARGLFHRLGFKDAAAPLLDADATRDTIHALVADELRAELRTDDSLVLFYAGHGATRRWKVGRREITTGYLIPADAGPDLQRISSWIELDAWLHQVALLPAKHILVILDACYSGIALNRASEFRGGDLESHDPLATLRARHSRRIITSALDNEYALDSGPILGHSVFTGCLIEGLTGGIHGINGVTTGASLGVWLSERVRRYPEACQTPASGVFDYHDHGEMVIPLARRRPGSPPPIPERLRPPVPSDDLEIELVEAVEPEPPVVRRGPGRALAAASSALGTAAFAMSPAVREGIAYAPPIAVIEQSNPFVHAGGLAVQARQVTRGEYALWLETLRPEVRAAMRPRFDWDGTRMDEPLTSITFRQAAAFCSALDARLPTAEEWDGIAGGAWGLDPGGSGQRGPNREWTQTRSDNGRTILVRGATEALARSSTAAELERELRTPYYRLESTFEPAPADRDEDPLSSPEIGFRCVR